MFTWTDNLENFTGGRISAAGILFWALHIIASDGSVKKTVTTEKLYIFVKCVADRPMV
jgi:hypothetical protein